jgi:hypothetical protein
LCEFRDVGVGMLHWQILSWQPGILNRRPLFGEHGREIDVVIG